MTFRVGMKVVCIFGGDENPLDLLSERWGGEPPVKGAVYTIRAIEHCRVYNKSVLRLDEIANDNGYWIGRFRPAVERKTDISIFKRMLTDQNVEA